MGDLAGKVDVEMLISYSDDLVEVLKANRDVNNLTHSLQHSRALRSHCDSDFSEVQQLLREYEEKIDACKKKTEQARSEIPAESEMEYLQKELKEELEQERALKEELRGISHEINELGCKRTSIQGKLQTLKRLEQEELKNQKKLSMYASVTKIIPLLGDPSRIAGHIADKEKNVVERFEFDPMKVTAFDACDDIWEMIDSE